MSPIGMIDEPLMRPVFEFLLCRTPQEWVKQATSGIETLLQDHAVLELKAAQQAQKIIWKYGVASNANDKVIQDGRIRYELVQRMSRLAREELRHFEQVLSLLNNLGIKFEPVSASRYAEKLHREVRDAEPGKLIDSLIVGGIIEARSCERFYCLIPDLQKSQPDIAKFYRSLLRSEARHFEDYLQLASAVSPNDAQSLDARVREFLEVEAAFIKTPDQNMRFHSGVDVNSLGEKQSA